MAVKTHVADKKSFALHIFICGAPFAAQAQPKDGEAPSCKDCKAKALSSYDMFEEIFNPFKNKEANDGKERKEAV